MSALEKCPSYVYRYPNVNVSLCSRCFPYLHLVLYRLQVQASSITQPLAQCCNNAGNTVVNPVLVNLTSRSKNDLKEKHMLLEALWNGEASASELSSVVVFSPNPIHYKNNDRLLGLMSMFPSYNYTLWSCLFWRNRCLWSCSSAAPVVFSFGFCELFVGWVVVVVMQAVQVFPLADRNAVLWRNTDVNWPSPIT